MTEQAGGREGIKVRELGEFLNSMERTDRCPYCAFEGAWTFHVNPQQEHLPISERTMALFHTISPLPGRVLITLAISCGRCGHVTHMDAGRVNAFLEGRPYE